MHTRIFFWQSFPVDFDFHPVAISPSRSVNCPICGGGLKSLSDNRFGVCPADKLIANRAFKPVKYEQEYFHKEYKNQYGRAYTADHQAILERNRLRYNLVRTFITAESHPQVLEVGSAAGYFLKIMQEQGFSVRGWEISDIMSKYANARGLKTIQQDFFKGARSHAKKKSPAFDILAMFYVLEHLPDQKEVWMHFERMVRPGGFLLLALPSAAGPMFRFHRSDWYAEHPIDHCVDYTPAAVERVGKKFGFKLRSAYSEGKHPDRFPFAGFSFMQSLYLKALERSAISDTVFVVLERES